jgi:hypothetical protein
MLASARKWSASSGISSAVAQRRNVDRDNVQPEVEVLAECAVANALLEILVRRREDSHVDADRLRAADTLQFALLEREQDLDGDGEARRE